MNTVEISEFRTRLTDYGEQLGEFNEIVRNDFLNESEVVGVTKHDLDVQSKVFALNALLLKMGAGSLPAAEIGSNEYGGRQEILRTESGEKALLASQSLLWIGERETPLLGHVFRNTYAFYPLGCFDKGKTILLGKTTGGLMLLRSQGFHPLETNARKRIVNEAINDVEALPNLNTSDAKSLYNPLNKGFEVDISTNGVHRIETWPLLRERDRLHNVPLVSDEYMPIALKQLISLAIRFDRVVPINSLLATYAELVKD